MITGINHVAIRSGDLSGSIRYYTDVLGLKEAFRLFHGDGSVYAVFIFLSPGQYLELIPRKLSTMKCHHRDERFLRLQRLPFYAGVCHISLTTQDINTTYESIRINGGPIDSEIQRGQSGCFRFWTHDPDGTKIEIMEVTSDSMLAETDRKLR